jgi:hypothetical protein
MLTFAFILQLYRKRFNPREYYNQTIASPIERSIFIYVLGVVGLTAYVMLVGMAPFRCFRQMDGTYTLVSSSSFNCYDEVWHSNMFTIVLGVVEIAMIPAGLFWILFHHRRNLYSNKFVWRFGHLTNRYKKKFFWWEAVVIMKKLTFVMVVELTNDFDRHIRVLLAESVLISGLFLESFLQPRAEKTGTIHILYSFSFESRGSLISFNRFQLYNIFALLVGILIFDVTADSSPAEVSRFQVLLISLLVALVCAMFVLQLSTLIKRRKEANNWDQLRNSPSVAYDVQNGTLALSQVWKDALPDTVMSVNPIAANRISGDGAEDLNARISDVRMSNPTSTSVFQ